MSKKKAAGGIPVYCAYDKLVKTDTLKPNPKNPNQHPDNQIEILEKLIREHGWRNPVTVSNRSGLIVRGHGRYMAALVGNLTHIPVDFQDYDSDEAEILDLIADNKIAELSTIDDDLARELLGGLTLYDFYPEPKTNKQLETDGQGLVDAIEAEAEIKESAGQTVDEIKDLISRRLDTIAEVHPAELGNATAVILSNRKGCNDAFILADPNLKDFIDELRRYADSGVESPLESMLEELYSMQPKTESPAEAGLKG